jgi:cytochrome b pre-mRNA-processing protein 3
MKVSLRYLLLRGRVANNRAALGLTPNFVNWSQITFIHMYMLQVRFRMLPETHAPIWTQHLTNHAFYAAEDRLVVWHQMTQNGIRQRHLKDLFNQWRAVLLSYDEGIYKGDAVLATAIWRNLFAARDDVDFEKLAQVVSYMRRGLMQLVAATDDEVLSGAWKFDTDPGTEEALIKAPSKLAAEVMKARD